MLQVHSLLHNLGIDVATLIKMYYDNQTTIFIANNLVFHECIKDIKFDCHFIRDLLMRIIGLHPATNQIVPKACYIMHGIAFVNSVLELNFVNENF